MRMGGKQLRAVPSQLSLPGFRATRTSLIAEKGVSEADWQQVGEMLAAMEGSLN
jgi:hypothetical protein